MFVDNKSFAPEHKLLDVQGVVMWQVWQQDLLVVGGHSYTLTPLHSYTLTLLHSYTLTLLHSYTLALLHSYTKLDILSDLKFE